MNARHILAMTGASVLALGLAACGGSGEGGGSGGGDEGGTVKVGIKFDQPGLGQKDGNEYTGFDVDVANYLVEELGYDDVEFVQAPSPQRETLLQSGQVDMIVATYSITDERAEDRKSVV